MYPKEYMDYLVHFHGDRDYFECHEVLEEFWKTKTDQRKDSVWVGLILLAVSCYHHRRKNFQGALKTLQKSVLIFKKQEKMLTRLGIQAETLLDLAVEKIDEIKAKKAYESIHLPITDSVLYNECLEACLEKGWVWGEKSDVSNQSLIDRHLTRDRTDVLNERLAAIEKRKNKGSDSTD